MLLRNVKIILYQYFSFKAKTPCIKLFLETMSYEDKVNSTEITKLHIKMYYLKLSYCSSTLNLGKLYV